MKVLVTGGTGFVGRHVVRRLHVDGHSIRLLVRNTHAPSALKAVEQYGVELCPGDILQESSLAPACASVDAVVHLIGIIAEQGNQTFENVHARGTRNLVAAARSEGVRKFVHMSALGTRPGAASRYHQTKWAAEQTVRRSDMAWVIFRPSIIYGPGDGFVSLFERMSRYSPVIPLIGGGHSKLQPVRVEEVAECFAQALVEFWSADHTYDLCGPKPLTLREVIETVLRVMSRRRLLLTLPVSWMRFPATILETVHPALFGQPAPLSRDQLVMLQEDNVGQPEAAVEQFRLTPPSFEQGLAAYLKTRAESG